MGKESDSESDQGKKTGRRRHRSRTRSNSSSSDRNSGRSRSSSRQRSRRHSKRKSRSRSPSRSKNMNSFRRNQKSSSTDRSSSSWKDSSGSSKSSYSKWSNSKYRQSKDSKYEKEDISLKAGRNESSNKTATSSSSTAQDKNSPELLKQKLQLALKAAADADAALREQGVLTGYFAKEKNAEETTQGQGGMNIKDQLLRAKAIDDINSNEFHQQSFVSGKTNLSKLADDTTDAWESHDAAIFGVNQDFEKALTSISPAVQAELQNVKKDVIAHENLFIDPEIQEERWIKKLMNMRQRKLNGEAMF